MTTVRNPVRRAQRVVDANLAVIRAAFDLVIDVTGALAPAETYQREVKV